MHMYCNDKHIYTMIKRAAGIILSLVGLVLLSPLLFAIALLVNNGVCITKLRKICVKTYFDKLLQVLNILDGQITVISSVLPMVLAV